MIFETKWEAPSNIALVKYWGKKDIQKPLNPSLSFSLSDCKTITRLSVEKSDTLSVCYLFEGEVNPKFEKRVAKHIENIAAKYPELRQFKYNFSSENTFPHSTGIASSASSFASINLCLEEFLSKLYSQDFSLKRASENSRLASGSASRSVYSDYVAWGDSVHMKNSSDYYGVPVTETHPVFDDVRDSVLVVDRSEKSVSSSQGHKFFNESPYKDSRVKQANKNFSQLTEALKSGDKETFTKIIIEEAHSLHAMMMLSPVPYMLMKPKTITIINKIEELRTNHPNISYTLDAGPNIHLIYFGEDFDVVKSFIQQLDEENLLLDVIHDRKGKGPKRYEQ